jgi:hypothetical protein
VRTVVAIRAYLALPLAERDSPSRRHVVRWIDDRIDSGCQIGLLIRRAARCRWWTDEVLDPDLIKGWWDAFSLRNKSGIFRHAHPV